MTKKAADKIVKHMEDYYRVDDAVDEPVVFTQWDDAKNYSLAALLNELKKNPNWQKQFFNGEIMMTPRRMGKTIYANTITRRDRDLRRSRYFEMDYAALEKRVLAHVATDPDDMEAMRAKPPVKLRGGE